MLVGLSLALVVCAAARHLAMELEMATETAPLESGKSTVHKIIEYICTVCTKRFGSGGDPLSGH
jgi:hypothetical protein